MTKTIAVLAAGLKSMTWLRAKLSLRTETPDFHAGDPLTLAEHTADFGLWLVYLVSPLDEAYYEAQKSMLLEYGALTAAVDELVAVTDKDLQPARQHLKVAKDLESLLPLSSSSPSRYLWCHYLMLTEARRAALAARSEPCCDQH